MKGLVSLNVEELIGLNYECSCGRIHSIKIRNINVGKNIVSELQLLLSEFNGRKVFIIEDRNSFAVEGKEVESILKENFQISK